MLRFYRAMLVTAGENTFRLNIYRYVSLLPEFLLMYGVQRVAISISIRIEMEIARNRGFGVYQPILILRF